MALEREVTEYEVLKDMVGYILPRGAEWNGARLRITPEGKLPIGPKTFLKRSNDILLAGKRHKETYRLDYKKSHEPAIEMGTLELDFMPEGSSEFRIVPGYETCSGWLRILSDGKTNIMPEDGYLARIGLGYFYDYSFNGKKSDAIAVIEGAPSREGIATTRGTEEYLRSDDKAYLMSINPDYLSKIDKIDVYGHGHKNPLAQGLIHAIKTVRTDLLKYPWDYDRIYAQD